MLNKEIVKELKNKLKEVGYNRNLVSVKASEYDVKVIIKNESVDYIIVKGIVSKYNSRSIVIDFEESLKESLVNSLKEYSQKIFNTHNEDNCLNMFYENDNYKLLYTWRDEQLFVEDKNADCSYPKMIEKFNVHTVNDLNYCLMRACLRYKININNKEC